MRMRRLVGVVAVLAAVLVTVGCATLVTGKAVSARQAVGRPGVSVTGDGHGVTLGTAQDGQSAVIDLFIEPQCPHCGTFIAEYGDAIAKYVANGRLTLTIRPLTFLDRGSDDYSARATNAIFLVAADDKATSARVWKFIQQLYAQLMSTMSLADDDGIAQVANDVGASANTVNRIAAAEPEVDADEVNKGNLAVMDTYGVQPATPAIYDTIKRIEIDPSDTHWLDDLVR